MNYLKELKHTSYYKNRKVIQLKVSIHEYLDICRREDLLCVTKEACFMLGVQNDWWEREREAQQKKIWVETKDIHLRGGSSGFLEVHLKK